MLFKWGFCVKQVMINGLRKLIRIRIRFDFKMSAIWEMESMKWWGTAKGLTKMVNKDT